MNNSIDKALVIKNFDQASTTYDEVAVLQHRISEGLIEKLDFISHNPERLLDIGSGTGKSIKQLKKKYRQCKIIQLDISAKMLLQAKRSQSWFAPRHHYIQADAESLPLLENSMDLVFSNLTLQWCEQPERVFTEVLRVLKPGGHFIFSTFGPSTLTELRQCWARADDYTHVNTFIDMHDLGDVMTRRGLENVVMEMEIFTMTYKDGMDLMRELKKLGASNINSDRRKGLTGKQKIERVLSAYEEFREDGRLPASFEVIYGHGWKPEKTRSQSNNGSTSYIPIENLVKNP